MAEIIRFETNIPQTVAFKFADGREVEGRFGAQYMYTTTDGRICYFPPIVATKLNELEVKPGEQLQIVKAELKDGRRKGVEWQVTRLQSNGAAVQSSPAVQPVAKPEVFAVQSQQTNSTPAQSPVVHTQTSQAMSGALIAAIDSLTVARKYAAAKGWELEFNEEDVRATAASIYIQFMRNGGGSWLQ